MTSKVKRRREMLALSEKVKILNMIEIEKKSFTEIAKMYGKNESSIRAIMKNKNNIRTSYSIEPHAAKFSSTVRDRALVQAEKSLSIWLKECISNSIHVDGNTMQQKALSLYEDFRKQDNIIHKTKPFTASKGWLNRFKAKFNLKNLTAEETEYSLSTPEEVKCSERMTEDVDNTDDQERLIKDEFEADYDNIEDRESKTAIWTLDKLNEVFQIAENLKSKIYEYDPMKERSFKITELITEALDPLNEIYDELIPQTHQCRIQMSCQKTEEVSSFDSHQASSPVQSAEELTSSFVCENDFKIKLESE